MEVTNGSSFARGNSSVNGKAGTKTGQWAMVLAPDGNFYEPNTRTNLYMPGYDFSQQSIYTLSFWARYDIHPGPDGFNVEYTTDNGLTWRILGNVEPGWYNFNNEGVPNSAFPSGTPYFTSVVGGYTNYKRNVSFLSGNEFVAFRFVFRSEATGFHPGVAIDDFEVTKFEGELQTALVDGSFTAEFTGDKEITLNWTTRPEYFCTTIRLERSINGRDYDLVTEVPCKGGVSDLNTKYTFEDQGGRDLYFYRLLVTSEDDNSGYFYEFYSPVVTVRRRFEGIDVFNTFPNPFNNQINITFTEKVGQNVKFELFDQTGRLIQDSEQFINDVFYSMEVYQLPMGVYFLAVTIGDKESKVFPVMGGIGN